MHSFSFEYPVAKRPIENVFVFVHGAPLIEIFHSVSYVHNFTSVKDKKNFPLCSNYNIIILKGLK